MLVKMAMAAASLLAGSGAACASTDGPELWRGLLRGMTAQEAAAVMAAMPEIRSVKVLDARRGKPAELKVSVTKAGVVLFGTRFELAPRFDERGLNAVVLSSGPLCVDEGAQLFNRTIAIVAEKYPAHLAGPMAYSRGHALDALRRSYDSAETSMENSIFNGDQATVLVSQGFAKRKPPEYMGSSQVGQLLYKLARDDYDSAVSECGGTGDDRMVVTITYVAKSDFTRMVGEQRKERLAEDQAARAGL